MKKGLMKKFIFIGVAVLVVAAATITAGCVLLNKDKDAVWYDNENDALVFSTLEVDKVFNPFFSTSATDSSVVGMTQMGMLGNDEKGNVTFGEKEAVVTEDFQSVYSEADDTTTYYFVLKNNIRFSNGSYLTIKDVFFNLYVYLDPVYSGSSTIYSTDIVGLKEYRTQAGSKNEQDNFRKRYEEEAKSRIDALITAKDDIKKEYTSLGNDAQFLEYLKAYVAAQSAEGNTYFDNAIADYNKTLQFFKEELNTDYNNSLNSYQDIILEKKDGTPVKPFTSDIEAFLYNEDFYEWDEETGTGQFLVENVANLTKESAIETVYAHYMPASLDEIVTSRVTSTTLFDYIVNQEMEKDFSDVELRYPNISGIQFANYNKQVVVNGKTYEAAKYDQNNNVLSDSREVLSITINGVDPKAVWNFAFTVAPMYYYSNEEQINKFSFENHHYGVEYASQTFMNEVVKSPDKIGVPVGAGAYAASKSDGGIENIKAGDFYDLGVIYFERNPYYAMGPAAIKKVRFQVVSSNRMLDALYTGSVDFVEPNAKPETIQELNSKVEEGIGNKSIRTSGYGYIGVNAGKIPSVEVRQAIMHAINTQLCVDYYQTTASPIYRPMSLASWAYPQGCTPYYPYIGGKIPGDLSNVNPAYADFVELKGKQAGQTFTEAEQIEFITSLVVSAGFNLNNGIYEADIKGFGVSKLDYVFTVAGSEQDHPAWSAMLGAAELLNQCGFKIRVTTDANALSKLSSGALTVWAAAWGSTIDPDMYQVYHMDSQATSTLNWGYKQIKRASDSNAFKDEYEIICDLSDLIEEARSYEAQEDRKPIYEEALQLVMELAVELPTYQRNDLYAYNTDKIDVSTFTPDNELSPFKGLTSDLHEVSLNQEK